ncbi:NADH-dependent flavin oxidoreductase [Lactococcus termiticola]|uniref:NADH-dependent flavin oxidoreductase n=1 Tax=Lactococcus termiticola TaxID=2169526 RepID=A0A2R5HGF4_9LACT|nr:NADH-dependent flavin oxidoreductase [Lactococcus termiticola]GBG96415.1 NADH-dependent flavin oxidoreductase [Lactococcus termiticola]
MPKLNESLTLRSGITLKNRLFVPPMTVVLSFHDGAITTDEVNHYAEISQGSGLVITGTANVTENGKGWPGELSVTDDSMIEGLSRIAKAIQDKGAKAILQIFHAGRMSSSKTIGEQVVSASAIPAEMPGAEIPRELSEAEILEIIEAFGQATRRAIAAGFDGVEIHGANTYLIQQFFSEHSNRRNDAWGGSLEKRANFPKAVTKRVFEEVEKADRPFAVGYRLSPVEATTPGIRLEDSLYLIDELKAFPLDYLHVSLKSYDRKSNSPELQEKSELAYIHDRIDGAFPLLAVGGVRDRVAAEGILEDAELAGVAQQTLVDPSFAQKLLDDRDAEIVTKPFAEAIYDLPMAHPKLKYLERRYL